MRQRRRNGLWILIALATAALATGCGAADEAPPTAMTGEVLAVDAMNRSIEVKGAVGESGTYHLDESTKIMSGGLTLEFQDLATGSRVVVDAAPKGGRMVASYVEVVDE